MNKTTKTILTIGAVVAMSATSMSALATGPNDVGGLMDNLGSGAASTLSGIEKIMALVGFILFAINGFKLLSNKQNQQESSWQTWAGLLSGIFLVSVVTYQAIFVNTVLSTDKQADDIRAVINGSGSGT